MLSRDLTPTELRYLDRDILADRVAKLQALTAELAQQRDEANFRVAELATAKRPPVAITPAVLDAVLDPSSPAGMYVSLDDRQALAEAVLRAAGIEVTR